MWGVQLKVGPPQYRGSPWRPWVGQTPWRSTVDLVLALRRFVPLVLPCLIMRRGLSVVGLLLVNVIPRHRLKEYFCPTTG